jgi:four helix bundle protein
MSEYIKLGDLEIYRLSLELSDLAWEMYEKMDWQIKKVMGDQFVRAIDSIGANIAEGYGRYHHRDKIKFYYNSRGSLLESKHWTFLLQKRNIIDKEKYEIIMSKLNKQHKKLNLYIKSCSKNLK